MSLSRADLVVVGLSFVGTIQSLSGFQCNVNTCKSPANNIIEISDIGVNPGCACVYSDTDVVFQDAGSEFAAIFGNNHPFLNPNRVHTSYFYPTDRLTTVATAAAFKYMACHLGDTPPTCMDPKLIVKPVGPLEIAVSQPEIPMGEVHTGASKLSEPSDRATNKSGPTVAVSIVVVGSPFFTLASTDCQTLAKDGTCQFTVSFRPESAGDFRAAAQIVVNGEVVKSVELSGKGI